MEAFGIENKILKNHRQGLPVSDLVWVQGTTLLASSSVLQNQTEGFILIQQCFEDHTFATEFAPQKVRHVSVSDCSDEASLGF